MVNKTTGEINHIATSQFPLADDKVGHPKSYEITHQLIRFEFDAEPDNGHNIMRARTALSEFEIVGNTPEEKSLPTAIVKSKIGKTRATKIMEGKK